MEANGKSLYVGVYSGNLITPSLPAKLAQLFVAFSIRTAFDNPVKTVSLEIEVPGNKETIKLGKTTLPEASVKPSPGKDTLTARSQFVLNDLVLTEPGYLRVWAITESETLLIGEMLIATMAQEAPFDATLPLLAHATTLAPKLTTGERVELLEEIAPLINKNLRAPIVPSHVVVPLDNNSIRIFYGEPLPESRPPVIVNIIPHGASYEVLEYSRYSASIKFSPENMVIEGFQLAD